MRVALLAPLSLVFILSACNSSSRATTKSTINVVAAENEYGNIAQQIGGRYVNVTSIMSNPNTDPHDYEASPSVAGLIANAGLVIQNGLGYDSFINKLEGASPNNQRTNIDVQTLLGLANSTPNPHLWYKVSAMAKVAAAITQDLSDKDPSHKKYFLERERGFVASLAQINREILKFKETYHNIDVATTEPVSDYLLNTLGIHNLTPWPLQAAIMNGVDPSPEDVSIELNLLANHKVNIFIYNQQVTDSLTQSFISAAQKSHIPVVGVYETMPTPGYDYQTWMEAEIKALQNAITQKKSTSKL